MSKHEVAIKNAFTNGVACAKVHVGQVAKNGVPFELRPLYSKKSLRDAWCAGVSSVIRP